VSTPLKEWLGTYEIVKFYLDKKNKSNQKPSCVRFKKKTLQLWSRTKAGKSWGENGPQKITNARNNIQETRTEPQKEACGAGEKKNLGYSTNLECIGTQRLKTGGGGGKRKGHKKNLPAEKGLPESHKTSRAA